MAGTTPETTGGKQDTRFQKGQSGNPAGRPAGARNQTTRAIEALLDGEGETITRKAIEMALGGDITAMRLCLERIIPARKDRPVTLKLPVIHTAADAVKASAALLQAVAAGDVTPGEASELGRLIESHARVLEVTELEERLARLERVTSQ